MSLPFSLNTPSCSLLCVWILFPPWHQQEFYGCLQSKHLRRPPSLSVLTCVPSVDTGISVPSHTSNQPLPSISWRHREALIRPAHLPCRNGKRVWCVNHALGSTAQGCVAPKYLPSPPNMCTEDVILLQEVPFPPHVLSSCTRPVQMANSSSVGMAELPSFVVLPHCDLTPSKRGSFPCHGHLFKGQVTFLISLSGF